jgi:hypothetical protein
MPVWCGFTRGIAFMPEIDAAITEGLATLEKVRIRFYRSGRK